MKKTKEKTWENVITKHNTYITVHKKPPFGKFVAEVLIIRSSRSQMFFQKGVLKYFPVFTGKHLCWPLQAFFYRTPKVASSGISLQQILFFSWIWYLLLTVAPFFNSFVKAPVKPHKKPLKLFCKGLRNFCKFHRKTPPLKSLFNRVAGL